MVDDACGPDEKVQDKDSVVVVDIRIVLHVHEDV